MTITEELAAASVRPGPPCAVCVWLKDRPDRAEWDQAMVVYGKVVLHRVMARHGYTAAVGPIERHKKRHVS